MEKIRFRCSNCGKTLAIDAKHAGKVAPCPGCQNNLTIPTVPAESASSPNPSGELQTPTADPLAAPLNPFSLDSASPADAASTPAADALPAASDLPTLGALPAAGLESPTNVAAVTQPKASQTSIGKSLGGLFVAVLVAGIFSILWLVIAFVTDRELGILAWGMGGAIGLVAGLIGRNPSKVYCGLVAGIAVMGVLGAKAIMVAMIMALSWGADLLVEFADLSPERQKLAHATADQMLADGKFEGIEKQYAEVYTSTFFSGTDDLYDEMTEEMFEISDSVDRRILDELATKTPEEEKQLLADAHARHPEWIEDHNHYLAVIDAMLNEEGTLNDDLAAHAKSELAVLDNSWDDAYYESVAEADLQERGVELHALAAERINSMDEADRDQAVRNTLQRHLSWNVYPSASTAMTEKMHREGTFAGPLVQHAKATVEFELADEFADYFESTSEEVIEARDQELQIAVNEKLISLDAASRNALVAGTKSRYPDWYGDSFTQDDAQQELEEALEEIGTDGTLWGSILAVFTAFDLLWLFLGATTAFGTAHKYGTSE